MGGAGGGAGGGDDFPAAAEAIAALMQPLLRRLETPGAGQLLGARLSAVGFLASRGGEVVVTLWGGAGGGSSCGSGSGSGSDANGGDGSNGSSRVSRSSGSGGGGERSGSRGGGGVGGTDIEWDTAACALLQELGLAGVVGRSKGSVRVASAGQDHVWETMMVPTGTGRVATRS